MRNVVIVNDAAESNARDFRKDEHQTERLNSPSEYSNDKKKFWGTRWEFWMGETIYGSCLAQPLTVDQGS